MASEIILLESAQYVSVHDKIATENPKKIENMEIKYCYTNFHIKYGSGVEFMQCVEAT